VRDEITAAIAPHEHLLATVKQQKMAWNGHVNRSGGLATTIMQGTVEWDAKGEGRRPGGLIISRFG